MKGSEALVTRQGGATCVATHRVSSTLAFETPVVNVDREGIEVSGFPPTAGDVRFVWLEFNVPDEPGQSIRALGEVEPCGGGLHRRVRFKHLFPDQRDRLHRLLARRSRLDRFSVLPGRVVN